MLDPNALGAAVNLTQTWSAKVTLTPITDTALSMICREAPACALEGDVSYDQAAAHLVEVSRGADHAAVFNQAVELASGAVRRTLDFTRNTVNPHIVSVIDAYAESMTAFATPPMPYEVDAKYLPEVYKLAPGRDFVERWRDAPTASSPGQVNFGSYSADEILSLAKLTEDGDFNNSMAELLHGNDGEGVRMIAEVLDGRMDVERLPSRYQLPLSIVIKNIDMPKEGVTMSADSYNNSRSLVSNIAGKAVLGSMAQHDTSMRNSSLYLTINSGRSNTIEVNGEVYTELLRKGFSLEMLVGNEIIGRKYVGVQLLDPEAQEVMKKAYLNDRANRQAAHDMERKIHSRKAVQNVLRADLDRRAAAGEFTVEGDTRDRAWGRLRDFVDAVYKNEFSNHDPVMVISAAICLVWYAHTDAARLVDIMFALEKEQPNTPKEQIATLATLKYLCLWVTSQISVSADPQ